MTIRQQGGVFGRNPTFSTVDVDGEVKAESLDVTGSGSVDGPLVVGTGTAEAGLHVDQNIGGIFARFKRLSSQYIDIIQNSGISQIYAYGKNFQIGTGDAFSVAIRQNNITRMTFETNGDVTVQNGNLIIGTSGKGIDFSATSGTGTSELFDDYEEGTWTPSFDDVGSVTYTDRYGSYTKIGRTVYVQGFIGWSAFTAGGNLRLFGLPFAPVAIGNSLNSLNVVVDSNDTAFKTVQEYLQTGLMFFRSNTAGASTNPYGSSGSIFISGAYFA